MNFKYISFLIKFKSPLYGEVDNIKFSNALLKLFAEDGRKDDFIQMVEDGFQVSNFIKSVQSHISNNSQEKNFVPLIMSRSKIKEFIKKFLNELKNEDNETIYEGLKFARKIEKGKIEGVYIENKHIIEYILSPKDKESENISKIIEAIKQKETRKSLKYCFSMSPLLSTTKVGIDRYTLTAQEKELYSHLLSFPQNPYFLFIKIPNKYVNDIKYYVKEVLSHTGISKRRSIGYGKFIAKEYDIDLQKYEEKQYLTFLGRGICSFQNIKNIIDVEKSYFEIVSKRFISSNGELSTYYPLILEFSSLYIKHKELKEKNNLSRIVTFYELENKNILQEERIIVSNPLII